ncbi:MAG: ABC transporter permease [Bacteroidales bacterium]|nr:ABC transporter permease [Bacteroidales bacterium]
MKGFLIKEFRHIFRDFRLMLILFGMPVVQVLLFGFAITNDIKNAPIAILDNSKDYLTQKITDKILSSDYFILKKNLNTNNEIGDYFKDGSVKEVIIFGNNFAENFLKNKNANIQIITDASEPNTARLLIVYTNSIINDFQQKQLSSSLEINNFVSSGKLLKPVILTTEFKMLYNPELKSVFMFVPGIIAILLMLICAMMTSMSIAKEKELGTMEILLVSPLKPVQIIAGKVLPYVLLSFINIITILLISYFVFKMPVQGSVFLLLSESILFIIMSLSLGIFISTVSNTQQTAMFISFIGLLLPTILLSGFVFPIENMPLILQYLSNIMPSKWFIIIIKSIMLKGVGINYIWKETLIIIFMTAFFIVLSVKKFKIRLE